MMSDTGPARESQYESGFYEIRIKGHLTDRWVEWFDGWTITRTDDGNTVLSSAMIDQSALHGTLKKIRDLGLTLLSVGPRSQSTI